MSAHLFRAWVWLVLGAVFYVLALVSFVIESRATHDMSQLPALAPNVTVNPIENRELTAFVAMLLTPIAAMFCTFISGRNFILAMNTNKGVV